MSPKFGPNAAFFKQRNRYRSTTTSLSKRSIVNRLDPPEKRMVRFATLAAPQSDDLEGSMTGEERQGME